MLRSTSVALVVSCSLLCCLAGDIMVVLEDDECRSFTSCANCITHNACTWCVTKSVCTKQLCGNDNVIFPKQTKALMSGEAFCPRIHDTKQLTFASGKRAIIDVKITQIYLQMAFTPWKCEINLNGADVVVPAVLLGDSVYCESFEMKNESDSPYIEGTVRVLWNYNKAFDGSLSFKVCQCHLEPNCVACKKKS